MTTADCPPEQLTTDQAKARILEQLSPVRSVEPVRLQEALGRVLASDLIAPIDVPGFANSAMDGYALHRSDIKTAGQQGLTLAGYSTAGHPFNDRLKPGNCIRIMTGALLPEGADTVVMQEQTRIEQELVFTTSEVQPGDNVRNAGEDLRQDTQVLSAGHLLTSADLGLIASLGISQIDVVRRLSVAYFSTGDELVTADQTLANGQIYDSNRQTLAALLQHPMINAIDLGLAKDDPEELRTLFVDAAQQADVVITSGGVSVGDADFVKPIFSELGTIDFWRIAIKPGRPLAFGKLDQCWFFGLPGNPVSSYVTFDLFVRPALRRLAGAATATPLTIKANVGHAIRKRAGRQEYQRGKLEQSADGTFTVSSTGNQSSGVLSSVSLANCYIVLPAPCDGVNAGDLVNVQPFSNLL